MVKVFVFVTMNNMRHSDLEQAEEGRISQQSIRSAAHQEMSALQRTCRIEMNCDRAA